MPTPKEATRAVVEHAERVGEHERAQEAGAARGDGAQRSDTAGAARGLQGSASAGAWPRWAGAQYELTTQVTTTRAVAAGRIHSHAHSLTSQTFVKRSPELN